jgi:dihydrofolate reductase
MRKIILGVAITLDGFIEGPHGEYDWCFTDQDYGMKEFMEGIDAIFYGRKSYEVMMKAEGGAEMFGNKKSYIFSNSLKSLPGDAVIVSGDIDGKVREIRNSSGKDIWLFGGASLTSSLLKAGLVDELWLSVHPLLLGSGKKLFEESDRRIRLTLLSSKNYETGLVSLRYGIGLEI